jgi:hypothetical protein
MDRVKLRKKQSIASAMTDAVQAGTKRWTRQKKSEERHPGNVRYRVSRMTKEPRTTQKEAAWKIMESAYMAASNNGSLPAKARQIFYQARPKIMEMTDDKELDYNYFSQTLLPDYIAERGVTWNVVYDARGNFEEPHTNRCIGCGTLEVNNYLRAIKERPSVIGAKFHDAHVEIVGPSGGFGAVMYCEKEGFNPLFKAVNLANRYDLMLISNKGLSVTAARLLIDQVCGNNDLPLFVLHDFDFDGFKILGTLQRDTRRYQFTNAFEVIDLGLRLEDIAGLEREPAAATKTDPDKLRDQLAQNGATDAEADILLNERVELNAMTSDALIEMIERKLKAYGLKKVIPNDDVLAATYKAFDRSNRLSEKFEEPQESFEEEDPFEEEDDIKVPKNLSNKVRTIFNKNPDLRWDEALKIILGSSADDVREEKREAKKKSGDFSGDDEDDAATRNPSPGEAVGAFCGLGGHIPRPNPAARCLGSPGLFAQPSKGGQCPPFLVGRKNYLNRGDKGVLKGLRS